LNYNGIEKNWDQGYDYEDEKKITKKVTIDMTQFYGHDIVIWEILNEISIIEQSKRSELAKY
jgi:hypothetical protein